MRRLGKVQADMELQGERLNIRIADEKGNAHEPIQEERASLARELEDMGLILGELAYGQLRLRGEPKTPHVPRRGTSRLDVVG
jgi:hypothetical protein